MQKSTIIILMSGPLIKWCVNFNFFWPQICDTLLTFMTPKRKKSTYVTGQI